jgi:hypothetical protein
MNQSTQQNNYHIIVSGTVDPKWREWFDGFQIILKPGNQTELIGFVPDQAALHGILAKIHNLGLTLLSINQLDQSEVNPEAKMKYRVHRFDIRMTRDQQNLERFLNSLEGEVVTIIPNVKPTFQPMGATASVDFLFIIEKLE